jgi:acetyl esterase/lipase
MEKEGYKVARWLQENGTAAFVLKYRLDPREALRDAQRAVSLIRKEAEKYGIDENKIGVIGFSAGAHLAGNLVENNEDRISYDEIDAVSSRPDFWVGVYGIYGDFGGSGNHRSIKEFEAHKDIPPTFLVHAGNDSRVNVLGSVELYIALKEKGVPAELHVYEEGEHGFALETDRGPEVTSTVTDWSKRLLEWLKVRGIL